MNSPQIKNINQLKDLNNKLAMELIYATEGTDNGLLPINYILSQIEEECHAIQPSSVLQSALDFARKWINDVFDTTGLFSSEVIKKLSSWTEWWENACEALLSDQEPPSPPDIWRQETTPKQENPVPAPPCQEIECNENEVELNLNLNAEDEVELLREFISESNEHLQNIELGVLVLEDNPGDADTLNSIFRAFHTFKGGSALLDLTPVNRLAHELESLLDLARQHKLAINLDVINLILEGGDLLKKFTLEIQGQISGAKPCSTILIPTSGLIHRVKEFINATQRRKDESTVSSVSVSQSPPGITAVQNALENETPAAGQETKTGKALSSNADIVANVSSTQAGIIKVATQKLDNLVDLVGEMVIAESQITQDPALQSVTSNRLLRNLAQLARITNDLQKTAMSMRMVPIRSTFQKMNRLVRDIASKQGKEVELRLQGQDTELDRTIVEQLNDPLVHMVRNSIDHGLEKPEVRLASGKPAKGIVQLNAWHQGGNIVIEVMDDGAGLNKDRILNKGIEKGLVKPNTPMGEQEIFHLIFAPGFSTAEKVTDISGRGVGMDVVRRNIEQLRGKIEIQSTIGHGSRFTIFLPLTLAIIDGLMVSVGDQRFILPSLLVRESFRPSAKMISSLYERGELINVRGKLVPLLRLHEYFSLQPRTTDPTQSVVIVVGSEHEQRCLLVDNLLGKQEVVIKNLGEMFKTNKALAGAAILGDGRVGLILDIDYLVKLKSTSLEQAA